MTFWRTLVVLNLFGVLMHAFAVSIGEGAWFAGLLNALGLGWSAYMVGEQRGELGAS